MTEIVYIIFLTLGLRNPSYSTSQFRLAALQVLSNHLRLVATVLDSAGEGEGLWGPGWRQGGRWEATVRGKVPTFRGKGFHPQTPA